MLHHILVKWKEAPTDTAALCQNIEQVFAPCLSLPGVHGVRVIPNIIHRPNRYDLMIVIHMEEEALPAYDVCEAHRHWKEAYGDRIAQKAIFDCQ